MSGSLIITALNNNPALRSRMSLDAWIVDQDMQGQMVKLYREYADGDHRANMTPEMMQLLRIGTGSNATAKAAASETSAFTDNRMDNVIQTVVDRLEVKRIEDTGKAANEWAKMTLENNRFDAFQIQVAESAAQDGNSYVFVDYDEKKRRVRFTHEPAYDGSRGMLVLYETGSQSVITAAIKVWNITSDGGDIADTMRVNVYYADRIEKFVGNGKGGLVAHSDDYTDEQGVVKWVDPNTGEALGVPVIPFKNQPKAHSNYGRSAIDDAIPLQDVVNRLLHTLVIAAELDGFGLRWIKGANPPPRLTPGAWIVMGGDGLSKENVADIGRLEGSPITPFLEGIHFAIQEIDEITRTPNPQSMGSSASSGEALKQREIGLVGKVKRAQISLGNSWEDVLKLAHRIDMAYGIEKPPAYQEFKTQWRSAEIRNVAEESKTILEMRPIIGDEMTIRMLATLHDWTEEQIQEILTKKQNEAQTRAATLGAALPGFSGLQPPAIRDLSVNGQTRTGSASPVLQGNFNPQLNGGANN